MSTIYACGLRLPEGVQLQVADIDGARILHVRLGKGAKDRYVPLRPYAGVVESLLDCHPVWLFPARKGVTGATKPMCESGVQRAFRCALPYRSAGEPRLPLRPVR